MEDAIVTLAHISDLHATQIALASVARCGSKRALGWLSWQLRRRHRYRPSVLEALLSDLALQSPDQVAVTGDLTQIALEEEFAEAAAWLARIGPPGRVSAIPGNHDAYVRVPRERGWDLWRPYLASDREAAELLDGSPASFPSIRLRNGLAIVGVSSARPTLPLSATGRVGDAQRARLEVILHRLGDAGLCRVVAVHHPPVPGATARRRALADAAELSEVLRRAGAELVLHGHLHRTRVDALPGPRGSIPVLGVPSASHAGPAPRRVAAYHLYDVERDGAGRFAIRWRARAYDPMTGGFASRGPEEGSPLGAD